MDGSAHHPERAALHRCAAAGVFPAWSSGVGGAAATPHARRCGCSAAGGGGSHAPGCDACTADNAAAGHAWATNAGREAAAAVLSAATTPSVAFWASDAAAFATDAAVAPAAASFVARIAADASRLTANARGDATAIENATAAEAARWLAAEAALCCAAVSALATVLPSSAAIFLRGLEPPSTPLRRVKRGFVHECSPELGCTATSTISSRGPEAETKGAVDGLLCEGI